MECQTKSVINLSICGMFANNNIKDDGCLAISKYQSSLL